jgi:hypothetical protein
LKAEESGEAQPDHAAKMGGAMSEVGKGSGMNAPAVGSVWLNSIFGQTSGALHAPCPAVLHRCASPQAALRKANHQRWSNDEHAHSFDRTLTAQALCTDRHRVGSHPGGG